MGCQCANQKEEQNQELTRNEQNLEEQENNNYEHKDEIFGLTSQEGTEQAQLRQTNNDNFENRENFENDEEERGQGDYNERIIEDKNTKYADYPEKMLELINKIRENPVYYAELVEDSIQNIIEIQDGDEDEAKPKIIYKKKVKVALATGESAFRDAEEQLRNMESLPPLEFKSDICVPLPDNEDEIKDSSYLKEQVKIIRETTNVDAFFKDLIKIPEVAALLMIVDDNEKNPGKKRNAILNKDFKYIGISSKFIGKTFVAYFTFSK